MATWKPSRSLALIIGLVIVVIAVGIFLYRRSYPANLANRAIAHFMAARSFHVKANIAINFPVRVKNRERPFTNVIGVIDGDVQREAHGTPEFTGALRGQLKGRGEEFTMDGEIRLLNDAVAFRLTNFPVLVNPTGSLRNRWTFVPSALLQTRNSPDIQATLRDAFAELHFVGNVQANGQRVVRYTGTVTPETQAKLVTALQYGTSGNHGWNVLARLLRANTVRSVTLDITPSGEVHTISAIFIKKLANGTEFERAGVRLAFSDYNKKVSINRPPQQAHVNPGVFAKLFGTGELTPQQ